MNWDDIDGEESGSELADDYDDEPLDSDVDFGSDASFIENQDEDDIEEDEEIEMDGDVNEDPSEDGVEINLSQKTETVLPSGQTVEHDKFLAPDIALVQQRI